MEKELSKQSLIGWIRTNPGYMKAWDTIGSALFLQTLRSGTTQNLIFYISVSVFVKMVRKSPSSKGVDNILRPSRKNLLLTLIPMQSFSLLHTDIDHYKSKCINRHLCYRNYSWFKCFLGCLGCHQEVLSILVKCKTKSFCYSWILTCN